MAIPFSETVKTICTGFPHFCLSLNCRSHVPFPRTSHAFSPPTKLPFTSPSHYKNGPCTSGSCPFELSMQRACKHLLYNSLQCLKDTASTVCLHQTSVLLQGWSVDWYHHPFNLTHCRSLGFIPTLASPYPLHQLHRNPGCRL